MTDAASVRSSPYQGLTPFDERDAGYFFGRERESRLICADLFAAPLSLLYGASGVGKSSVLRAGVIPLLRPRADLLALVFSEWQGEPLDALKQAVLRALPGHDVDPAKRLAPFLRACAKASGRRLMLILDQFEEYSLYHPTSDDPFAEQFPEATALPDLSVSFLISLREEAVARLDRFEGRIPALFDNLRRIDHLLENSARDAIDHPLRKFTNGRVTAEPALVTAVLEQVRTGRVLVGESGRGTTGDSGGRIEAPYLQLVMTRIWNEEHADRSQRLRLTTLNRLGGAPTIVQSHLNAVMDTLTEEERDIAARVFQQLVTPSGTKIAHSVRDLADYAAVDAGKLRGVLDSLSRGTDRILRPVAELPDRPGDPRYEIFHDRLAPAILDWCSRQAKAKEVARAHEQQDAARGTLVQFVEAHLRHVLMGLDSAERAKANSILEWFVKPSGARETVLLRRLNEVHGDDVAIAVIRTLLRTSILREVTKENEIFLELAHDAFVEPILRWRESYFLGSTAPRYGVASPDVYGPYADAPVIANLLESGRVVVVLGAGASASSRPRTSDWWTPDSAFPPTALELKRFLATRTSFPANELDRTGLAELASYYALTRGRQDLDKVLMSIFGRTYAPARLHRVLAELARSLRLVIITTAFDTMMEEALREAGAPFTMIRNALNRTHPVFWRDTAMKVELLSPDPRDTIVYKMFGSPPSFILTEEDDVELFSLMAEGRLPPSFIRSALEKNHVLFAGMGLGALPQRLMLRQLLDSARLSRGWAIVSSVSHSDTTRWKAANIEPFDQDIDGFARQLANALRMKKLAEFEP